MKTNKSDEKRSDNLFEEATKEAAYIKGRHFLQEAKADPYIPSAEFNHQIQAIIEAETGTSKTHNRSNKLSLNFSKATALILVVLVILLFAIPNVAMARDWVTKLVIESNPKYVTYYLQNQNTDNEITWKNQGSSPPGLLPDGTYYPSYVPEGMKLMQLAFNVSDVSYYYQDVSDNFVSIDVMGSGSSMNLDNENLEEQSSETVNGMQATSMSKLGVGSVIWSDGEHIFMVSTTLSKEECLRIANGLTN
ncbi:MAG: DUF4367 domain-containing protein [Brevefilum fermentans]|jgi:hypothetical protein